MADNKVRIELKNARINPATREKRSLDPIKLVDRIIHHIALNEDSGTDFTDGIEILASCRTLAGIHWLRFCLSIGYNRKARISAEISYMRTILLSQEMRNHE